MTAHAPISSHLTPEDMARAQYLQPYGRLRFIAVEVGQVVGLDPKDILGKSRKADVARARHLVWFIAHRQGMSYSEIARRHGTDHGTVLKGVQRETAARKAGSVA